MKTILITGASGFIGRHTLPLLAQQDATIHAVFSSGAPHLLQPNILWHQVNLHDFRAVETLINNIKPTHLLHLAWYAKPNEYWTSPLNVNWLTSSIHLLNTFSKIKGERAVFIGTCAEYNWQYGKCNENLTPCSPKTLYGKAKYALYLLAETLAAQQNISFAWARLFFLFGTYEYPQRLIASAIRNLLKKERFQVKNGELIRDFLYINDAASALASLIDTDVHGAINIASGKPMLIKTLIDMTAKKLHAETLLDYAVTNEKLEDPIIVADNNRLIQTMNWSPKYTLDTALEQTIDWWKEHG